MSKKRDGICVVLDIKDFSKVHLNKDVGAIPEVFKRRSGEPAHLFVFDNGNDPSDFENEFVTIHLVRVPAIIRAFPTLKMRSYLESLFIIAKAYRYLMRSRVMLLFHLQPYWSFPLLLVRLINPGLYIHLKLDFNQDWLMHIKRINDAGSFLMKVIYGIVLKCADAVSVETKVLYNLLKEEQLFGVAFDSRLKYFPNGISGNFQSYGDFEVLKERVFITVGRLGTFQKNTELLVEALLRVDLKDWKFVFVGAIEPDFRLWLNEKMRNHPQAFRNISFVGFVADRKLLSAMLARAQVFCLSSRWEGSALSVLEAMQHGCALISTPVGIVPDLISSEVNASCISIDDSIETWVEILAKAVSGEIPLREFGLRGFEVVRKEYSWEAILDSMSTDWSSKC